MKNTFNVALVGCGTISYVHLTSLLHTEGTKIVALCDIKRERALEKAREYAPKAKIYTDFSEMLEKEIKLIPKLNIYEIIANMFYSEFCIYVM